MPLKTPLIDDRRYDDLVGEALARIPVHTPEWTNFNRSDPGVTLIEVFAFLTESLLYRANQIPDRNRKKFLQLLRIPLQSATPARGMITIANESPETNPAARVIPGDLEVRAGKVPFRTSRSVDVLPVQGRFYVKKKVEPGSPELRAYYQQLYASFRGPNQTIEPQLYESVPLPTRTGGAISLADTIDNCIWLALIVRDKEKLATPDEVRKQLAHRTLSIGVVPSLAESSATLPAGRPFGSAASVTFVVDAPEVEANGGLPETGNREPKYRAVETSSTDDLFTAGGILNVQLPEEERLRLWTNLDPLEAGVGMLPPAIEDAALDARVITWLRITPSAPTDARFTWMGINAAPVTQLARVANELLPVGTGEPDQVARLARPPVLAGSVRIFVSHQGKTTEWKEVPDLLEAGAEVPLPDPRQARKMKQAPTTVFTVNAEAGEVRFGDGTHGTRPPDEAVIRASYDYALGAAGNIGPDTIKSHVGLEAGFKVTNPLATSGGADAETVESGEKQISAYLQHRDRLVTPNDFIALTLRTPGVDVGRVEVLPNFYDHPTQGAAEVPGVVTLMVIPAYDALQPDAPMPRRPFLDAICRYLDPRRLITTEVYLRGPKYRDIWIAIGIKVAAGFNESEVCENVKKDVMRFLAPTLGQRQELPDDPSIILGTPSVATNGWKLSKPVMTLELAAVASRTKGVEYVNENLVLADDSRNARTRIDMTGLALPRVRGIRVTNGPAVGLDELFGAAGTGAGVGGDGTGGDSQPGGGAGTPFVQVPVIPEECR